MNDLMVLIPGSLVKSFSSSYKILEKYPAPLSLCYISTRLVARVVQCDQQCLSTLRSWRRGVFVRGGCLPDPLQRPQGVS